jgi:hypothetical protein
MNKTRSSMIALLFMGALISQAGSAVAQCRVDQRFGAFTSPSSAVYKTDLNENLGDWGTIFMGADTDTGACLTRTRDFLKYKLKSQNQDLNRWKGGLMGGDVFLVTAAALRLGTKGLLTSEIHNDILNALASYDFANWGGPCGRPSGNGCMDDYTVAAAGHAWAGTYLTWTRSSTWNGRDSGWFRGQAKSYIKLSVSPKHTLCVRYLSSTMCAACSDEYNTAYDYDWLTPTDAATLRNKIANHEVEVLSFEHGYENPSYGVGLLTSIGTALQGLRMSADSYVASEFQKAMVHGLFRTGQSHAPTNAVVCQASWLNNCVGFNCQMPGAHCLSGNCDPPAYGCADDPGSRAYTADMFPVRPLLDDASAFKFDPAYGIASPILGSPSYQFTGFCGSRFSPTASFLNDARYAAYYQIPYVWSYVSQPPLQGVNPVQHVDFPKPPSLNQPVTGTTTFSGWAFDGEGTLSAASFSFTLDGQPYALQNLFYGGSRQDVCNAYGLTNQGSCLLGWSGTFTPPMGFSAGTHTLVVTVRSANGLSTSTFRRDFSYQP